MSHFKSAKEALLQLLAVERVTPVYAIGKNQETINLNKSIPLNGILDDSCLIGDTWEGIKVQKPDTLPYDAIIVNCSSSIAPISVEKRIRSLHLDKPIIKYWEIAKARPSSFPLPFFVQEMEADYTNNRPKWDKIKALLADKASLKVFDDITKFRLSGDYTFMADYSVRLADQYFESFFELKKGEVFVDCGGFDGDTTEQFCKRCPEYEQVWFFEPSPANMAKATSRLAGCHNINRRNYEAYKTGLADMPGISVIRYDSAERNNYQYVVIEVDPEVCRRNRDQIVEALHAQNIIARKYFWPGCHKMEPYRSLQPNAGLLLPETERIAARVIVLPTGQTVEVETVARVCEVIREAAG